MDTDMAEFATTEELKAQALLEEKEPDGKLRVYKGFLGSFVTILFLIWAAFQIYTNTFGVIDAIKLSPHRYETCIVELDEHTTSATIIHYIKQGIDNLIRSLDQKHVPRELYCMLHFTGVLNPEVSFNTLIDANRLGEFHYPISDGINVTVSSSFSEDISYKLDLVSLAKEEGPIGVLSSLLLDPQSNQTVLQDIAELQNQSTQTNAFMLIQDPQITPPSQLLEKAGMRLLRSISEQRERHE
jgi:hypothetical protein